MYLPIPLLLASFLSVVLAAKVCKHNTGDFYKYSLATKTPYRTVANINLTKPNFKGCKAKKIWMLVRHGTRNPGDDTLASMKLRLPKIRNLILKYNTKPSELLRNSDLYNLAKWRNDIPLYQESILREEGEFEAIELAERMQARYPELFPFDYNITNYSFRYTNKQRTAETAKYFAAGLFGRRNVHKVYFPKPLDKDPILEFYKLCPRWKVEVDDNPDTLREKVLFENSSYMEKIIDDLNKALNLKEDVLSLDDIKLMYDACTFETAWNEVRKSPWCSVFDCPSIKAMEFLEDLAYYYVDGYGSEINYKQACPAFADMFNFLKGDNPNPHTVAYFTHSGTLLKMIAHLGLYKDKKRPKHSDYDDEKRQWKVSNIGSFATNLAFVLFDCKDSQKVATYHQERLVKLPACDEELCDLSDIKKYYKHSIKDCDFDVMCSLPNN